MARAAEERRELVEQPRGHAHEERSPTGGASWPAPSGRRRRGRRRDPGRPRRRAGTSRTTPASSPSSRAPPRAARPPPAPHRTPTQRPVRLSQRPRHPADILPPRPLLAGREAVDRERVDAPEVRRPDRPLPVLDGPADDHGIAVDRRGQDEPAVVVGVVPQQLDPRRGPGDDIRRLAERVDRRGPGGLFEGRGHEADTREEAGGLRGVRHADRLPVEVDDEDGPHGGPAEIEERSDLSHKVIPIGSDSLLRPGRSGHHRRPGRLRSDSRGAEGRAGPRPGVQAVAVAVAAFLMASTLSVFSQVNSGSFRPKWPPLAVFR